MSNFTIPPDRFTFDAESGALGLYQFATNIAKHYFCKTCGIYPFHETMRNPGHFRVNLGCIDEIDTSSMNVEIFDGRSV